MSDWREWFPWPIGTHWCAYERQLCWIVVPIWILNVIAFVLIWIGVL